MKAHIKKGDTAKVIAGNHKGKTGTVLSVNTGKNTVLLDGVRTVQKTTRKSEKNPDGGINPQNAPIHLSNVKKA